MSETLWVRLRRRIAWKLRRLIFLWSNRLFDCADAVDPDSEEWQDEADDYDQDKPCPVCGASMEWVECDWCHGQGYIDGDTLVEEDPLWYTQDDTEPCSECSGKGGWWHCWNVPHKEKADAKQLHGG